MVDFVNTCSNLVVASGDKTFMKTVTSSVNLPLCQAIAAFERKDYDEAVELLLPVRYKMAPLGGSRAQVSAQLRTEVSYLCLRLQI